ncbi:hypothetical protein C7M84_010649 [Penaeus vannamei]|uniref:Uncharacterized protein n=1 Tax=Penaeus vannamei TaxID=6689 RepID=A0A3R7PGH4_PENVA|nr:hypothetical protein C7M84_010649 [Penaeus vannamei]
MGLDQTRPYLRHVLDRPRQEEHLILSPPVDRDAVAAVSWSIAFVSAPETLVVASRTGQALCRRDGGRSWPSSASASVSLAFCYLPLFRRSFLALVCFCVCFSRFLLSSVLQVVVLGPRGRSWPSSASVSVSLAFYYLPFFRGLSIPPFTSPNAEQAPPTNPHLSPPPSRWSQGLLFHQAAVDCARAAILIPLGRSIYNCVPVAKCSLVETAFLLLVTVSTINMLTTVLNDAPLLPEDSDQKQMPLLMESPQCVLFGTFMIWFASITINLGPTFLSGALAANIDEVHHAPSCPLITGPLRHYVLNVLWIRHQRAGGAAHGLPPVQAVPRPVQLFAGSCADRFARHHDDQRDAAAEPRWVLEGGVVGLDPERPGDEAAPPTMSTATFNRPLETTLYPRHPTSPTPKEGGPNYPRRRLRLVLRRNPFIACVTVPSPYPTITSPFNPLPNPLPHRAWPARPSVLVTLLTQGLAIQEAQSGLTHEDSRQVTLHVAYVHAFVNPALFLALHKGLRKAVTDIMCCHCSSDERSSRSAGLGAIQTNMTGSRPSLGGGLGGSMSASGGLSGTGLSGGLSTSGLSGATAMSTAGGAQAMPHFDCDGDITPPFSSINRPYLFTEVTSTPSSLRGSHQDLNSQHRLHLNTPNKNR